MKKLMILTFLMLLCLVIPVSAEMEVSNLGVRVIESGENWTDFSWKLDIYSNTNKSSCALIISFRDSQDFEIHEVFELISLSQGSNHFTGKDICKTDIWNQIDNFTASIKCH